MPFFFRPAFLIFAILCSLLAGLTFWPEADLFISNIFYDQQTRFVSYALYDLLTDAISFTAKSMAVALLLVTLFTWIRKKPTLTLPLRAWLFLFLTLFIGPGLIVNGVFKDHWGRARPRATEVFGGTAPFTPAFQKAAFCERNCSFSSGDAAFGFFFPAFAYLAPTGKKRRRFWGLFSLGLLFGGCRIVTGAHFLSDVLASGVFVTLSTAAIYAALYGIAATKSFWKKLMGYDI